MINAALYDPPVASTKKPISIGVKTPANWAPVLINPLAVPTTASGRIFSGTDVIKMILNDIK